MAYSVQDLKNDLTGILHGTTTNQIQNLNGVINRAARQLLLDLDPQETKRQVEFVAPIFNTVYDYPIAADVKGNKIIDIYPQVQRLPWDVWTQAYNQAFDVMKQNIFSMANMFTINFNTSLKTIRINAPYLNPPIIISNIDDITDNGTWSLSKDAINLTVNNTNYAQGSGSLQFDIDVSLGGWVSDFDITNFGTGYSNGTVGVTGGSGTGQTFDITQIAGVINSVSPNSDGLGYQVGDVLTLVGGANNAQVTVEGITTQGVIENSTIESVNLSDVENQASFFTWVYIPTAADLTQVELRIGSSATDYYLGAVEETQQGTDFINGWNLLQFEWNLLSPIGTPDPSAITYARIMLTVTEDVTAAKVNGLNCILGTVLSYEYYSKYMFRDASTGAYQETVTDDSNLINLDTESFNLMTNLVAFFAAQQQQGIDAGYDASYFKNQYDAGIIRYKSMYKSELQKPQSVYYSQPNTGYNRIWGRGYN